MPCSVGRTARSGATSGVGRFSQALAVLAVLWHLLAALLLTPDAGAVGLLADMGVICHAGGGAPPPDHAPAHHPIDRALCPLRSAPALLAPIPAAALVAAPRVSRLAAALPPVRAGPVATGHRLAAQPRGPPAPA